jgi:glycine cleavage system H lipoate-binding protein
MTVILVLATFLVFVALDIMLRHRKQVHAAATVVAAEARLEAPAFIEGFLVPEDVRYHAGHGWALRERKQLMRVGIDEFAASLLGGVKQIEMPKPGRWIRQGQRAWSFYRNGEKAEILSPVEGEVVEVNTEVLNDPSLLRKDPYGRGWLMTVSVPDEDSVARNLLPVEIVPDWMRRSVERLYARQPNFAGAVAADGGRPVDDLGDGLSGSSWSELTAEFFLT